MAAGSPVAGAMARPTEIEWAMLAAYIDGEGSIIIRKAKPNYSQKSPQYTLSVAIYNTDPRLSRWLQSRFGGKTYLKDLKPPRKVCYQWRADSNAAIYVLQGCLPYFVMKREQAEVGLELPKIKCKVRWKRLSEEQLAAKELLKNKLHELHAQVVQ